VEKRPATLPPRLSPLPCALITHVFADENYLIWPSLRKLHSRRAPFRFSVRMKNERISHANLPHLAGQKGKGEERERKGNAIDASRRYIARSKSFIDFRGCRRTKGLRSASARSPTLLLLPLRAPTLLRGRRGCRIAGASLIKLP